MGGKSEFWDCGRKMRGMGFGGIERGREGRDGRSKRWGGKGRERGKPARRGVRVMGGGWGVYLIS